MPTLKEIVPEISKREELYLELHPFLEEFLGDRNASILLTYLTWYKGKGFHEDRSYHSISQIQKQICLTRYEQNTAIKHLKRYLKVKMENCNYAKVRHFKVNWDLFISEFTEWLCKKPHTPCETKRMEECKKSHTTGDDSSDDCSGNLSLREREALLENINF